MRSTILDSSKEERAKFDALLKDADIFFANKGPGYLESDGLDAEELFAKKPAPIHATVILHGETGPCNGSVHLVFVPALRDDRRPGFASQTGIVMNDKAPACVIR
jgi:CoA-transferase family III